MSQYQYGCFFVSSCFVLVPCVRYGYNSLKKVLLLCYCVARDTHFSTFINSSNSFVWVPCVRYGYKIEFAMKRFCLAVVLLGIRTLVHSFVCLCVTFNS